MPKEYLGAFKRGHRRASREFIDEEFSIELLKKAQNGCEESKKALEWLTRFNNEYHQAFVKKDDPNALHKTKKLRAECNNRKYLAKTDFFANVILIRDLKGL